MLDLKGLSSLAQKDYLTQGVFSAVYDSPDLLAQLREYANSTHDTHDVSVTLPPISDYPLLYQMAKYRVWFVPIHQQLVESFFSKLDTCVRGTDYQEMDSVRTGQYRTSRSRHVRATNLEPKGLRLASKGTKLSAKLKREAARRAVPCARQTRKRSLADVAVDAVVDTAAVALPAASLKADRTRLAPEAARASVEMGAKCAKHAPPANDQLA